MPQLTIQQAYQIAAQQHQAGNAAQAEEILRQILAHAPGYSSALQLMGVIAFESEQYETALDYLRRAVEAEPNYVVGWNNLGHVLAEMGRYDEALAAYRRTLEIEPLHPDALYNVGAVLFSLKRFDEATDAFRKVLELQPANADALHNLGNCFRQAGQLDEALVFYRRAIERKPAFPVAHRNLGNALKLLGQLGPAIAAYRQAIALYPNFADAYCDLTDALRATGDLEGALAACQEALRLQPNSPNARFLHAALTGGSEARTTPAHLVQVIFDDYAPRFDQHLVEDLHYHVPELLRDAALAAAPGKRFDVLDLGCGTGLCGIHIRPVAKTLVGVDLSPKMIEKSAERKIYDELLTTDVTTAMRDRHASFDLILAGDVFIYVGDLAEVFPAAASALRPGGLFAFSIERHDGPGFTLHTRLRFAHSLAYIRELAEKHAFTEVRVEEIIVRKEGDADVPGYVLVLSKPDTATN